MGFVGAVKTCILKYAVFKGRASRSEFWWFVLFCLLMQVLTTVFDGLIFGTVIIESYEQGNPALIGGRLFDNSYNPYIISLLLLLPTLAASVRRLHDVGRSGFWILFLFLPHIFGLVLAIVLTMARAPTLVMNSLVGACLLIPIISFVVLVFWWVQPSMAGQNDYDAAPLPPHLRGEPDFR